MKKNRILSLVLSVMMMFTIVFPTGAFAEEIDTQEYEPEVEEVVVDLGAEEPAPVEEPVVVDEQPVEEQPAEEQPAEEQPETAVEEAAEEAALYAVEEEELPFAQGYVRVNGGTIVYAAESRQEEKGSFSSSAVVYAVVSTRATDEAYSWLKITFDTAEAKEANEALLSGYVQFKDVTVLSEEAVEELINALESDNTVRSYGDNLLPIVSFKAVEVEIVEEIADEEVVAASVAEEEIIVTEVEEIEVAVEEVYAASTTVTIIQQPQGKTVIENAEVTLTVEAENVTAYRWQYSPNNGSSWSNVPTSWTGSTTDSLTFIATSSRAQNLYRVRLTGPSGNVYSEVVSITLAEAVAITTQPVSLEAEVGDTVYFEVGATGEGMTYQWQSSTDNGETWTNTTLSGAKTKKLKVAVTKGRNGYQFRCVVTGSANSVTSDPAVLTVAGIVAIATQPVSLEAEVGDTVYFEGGATGEGMTYQWQISTDNGETWNNTTLSGAKTKKLKVAVTKGRNGYQFRCVVTGSANSVTSDPAVLTVNIPLIFDGVTYEPLTSTTCAVVSYSGTASSLIIPETVEGMTVVEIGVEAFMDNKSLVSIDLPDTITVIRARAFKGCTSLSDMH